VWEAILGSELFWSAVVFVGGWIGTKTVSFFVTKYPILKALKLQEKWDTVIALGNQYRKDQGWGDGKVLDHDGLMLHLKSLCAKYGVSYDDVQAWRRRQKDVGPKAGIRLEAPTEDN
jgi:hypothetical protein